MLLSTPKIDGLSGRLLARHAKRTDLNDQPSWVMGRQLEEDLHPDKRVKYPEFVSYTKLFQAWVAALRSEHALDVVERNRADGSITVTRHYVGDLVVNFEHLKGVPIQESIDIQFYRGTSETLVDVSVLTELRMGAGCHALFDRVIDTVCRQLI